MNAIPQPLTDQPDDGVPMAASLADVTSRGVDAPPPHVLWATLESAYGEAVAEDEASEPERIDLYLALPITIVLAMVMWVAVVELILTR